jgi:hypothetical protein
VRDQNPRARILASPSLEEPDEQQDYQDQCDEAATDVHAVSFRICALLIPTNDVRRNAAPHVCGHRPAARTRTGNRSLKEVDMPPRGVKKGSKRGRQYEHIKDSLEDRGASEDTAEEIAARTVNKERARHGESRTASRLSKEDISSGRRGGLRSGRSGPRGRTRDQLYEEAKDRNIRGRSKMTKAQLQRALGARSS